MNNSIYFTHSIWFLFLILALAFAASYLLYRNQGINGDWSMNRRIILGALRFVIIFVIGFLLLVPILKTIIFNTQKPLIIIAQDNSQSLILSKDSIYNRNQLPTDINSLVQQLKSKYEVKTLQFGEKIDSLHWNFSQKETNFETLFSIFYTGFYNQNIGALIISSDGIVNRGISPIIAAQNIVFPIYCIALGDTSSIKDLSIKQIDCNKIAFKGNTFPVFVNISANDLKGQTATIELSQNDRILGSQKVEVEGNQFFKKYSFQIKADSLGINEYKLSIKSLSSDANLLNNSKRFFVEVTENQKKILLLFNGYHPDIAVFQNALTGNQAFKLTKMQSNERIDSIQSYDLVILHQLPSKTQNLQKILPTLIEHEIPILFVLGQQTSLEALNNLGTELQIDQNKDMYTDIFPSFNPTFSLFSTHFDTDILNIFPPLQIPFGNYSEILSVNSFLYQRVGQINTSKPLWFFTESGYHRNGFILGEGIWKWYLFEYSQYSNHSITFELISKTVQYLTSNNRKEPLVIELPAVMDQEKQVIMNAKLYNPSGELVNTPELTLEITDDSGNKFPFIFQKNEWAYTLNLGNLPLGTYRYYARTTLGETIIHKSGKFIIQESQLEKNELIANHPLLYKLANEHQGKLFYKNQFDEIATEVLKNETILPKIFEKKGYSELINFKGFFILLIVLACCEWFLRKFWGSI